MKFVDEALLRVIAGAGGNGIVAFRREARVPRGGPWGGNGGKGGDVVLVASSQHLTLLDVKLRPLIRAERGRHGGPNMRSGRHGEDAVVEVPVGTLVYDADTGELIADLVEPGQRVVVAHGGRGGRGNAAFRNATRQAPDFAEPGAPGEERRLRLELKLIAEVGLVGLPNAGKSSLIRRLSAARPRVADYPFTTLVPNLGTVRSDRLGSYVIADIPGLIEGAHTGAGLGHRFLRHVERTTVLVHVLSASPDRDPRADLDSIERELERYSPLLAARPRVLFLNKMDLWTGAPKAQLVDSFKELAHARGWAFAAGSCLTGEGLRALQSRIEELVARARNPEPAP